MIGEIVPATVGEIPEEKDEKENIIQEFKAGRKFDLIRGGVSKALIAEGVFNRLMKESGATTIDGEFKATTMDILSSFNEKTMPLIKSVIINNVQAPVVDESSFEEIKKSHILPLFMAIYNMYNEEATEKKTEPTI